MRIALHAGECEERDGDYFGPAVNRVARLESPPPTAARWSSPERPPTWSATSSPSDVHLVDLGSHHLKDMERPEEVFQLTSATTPSNFPPLRSGAGSEVLPESTKPHQPG